MSHLLDQLNLSHKIDPKTLLSLHSLQYNPSSLPSTVTLLVQCTKSPKSDTILYKQCPVKGLYLASFSLQGEGLVRYYSLCDFISSLDEDENIMEISGLGSSNFEIVDDTI